MSSKDEGADLGRPVVAGDFDVVVRLRLGLYAVGVGDAASLAQGSIDDPLCFVAAGGEEDRVESLALLVAPTLAT